MRPASGEVNPEETHRTADAGPEFKQAQSQAADFQRTHILRQALAEGVDQVVGGSVEKQAEGIGQEAMTTQTVGVEAVFEFFDTVLALSAIIVKAEDFRSAPSTVGDQETEIGSDRRVLGFITDTSLA